MDSAGLPTESDEDVEVAARDLLAKCSGAVLVKRGAKGSMLIRNDPDGFTLLQPAVPAGRVVDTTGAGDCFTAAFAVALVAATEGSPVRSAGPHAEALKFAASAASICVQRHGAMPSMPRRQEVEDLLRS